jgi:hypothetical protein
MIPDPQQVSVWAQAAKRCQSGGVAVSQAGQ